MTEKSKAKEIVSKMLDNLLKANPKIEKINIVLTAKILALQVVDETIEQLKYVGIDKGRLKWLEKVREEVWNIYNEKQAK